MGHCAKCGTDRMMPNVRLLDRTAEMSARDLTAEVCEYPNALLFKGAMGVSLRAHICGSCGYCELYADTPEGLWRAYCVSLGQRGVRPSEGLPVVDGVTETGPSPGDS